MKIHLIRIAVISLLLLVADEVLGQDTLLSLDSVSGTPGSTVNLPVSIEGNFAAAQFDLTIDDDRLSLAGFSAASLPDGLLLDWQPIAADRIRVVVYDANCPETVPGQSSPARGGSLLLGNFQLTIASSAEPGVIALALSDITLADSQANALSFTEQAGQLEILAGSPMPEPLVVPALSSWALALIAIALAVAGLFMLRRRGAQLLVLVMAGGIAWLAVESPPLAAGNDSADPADIVDVILERQSPVSNEDCTEDSLIDVRDVICARNEICADAQNQPPQIAAIADQTTEVNEPFELAVQASDPDQDTLDYTLPVAPNGMTINNQGVINWTPNDQQLGANAVTVRATDPESAFDEASFQITVIEATANSAPTLIPPGNRVLEAGSAFNTQLFATDPDPDDQLTFDLPTAPAGMSVDAQTGVLTWTPDTQGINPVTARVSDLAGLTDTQSFEIEVIAPLPDPQINSSPSLTVPENQVLRFTESLNVTAIATDPDPGDTLTFSLINAPDSMQIDPASGAIAWSPNETDIGMADVAIQVQDPLGASAFGSFIVDVLDINRAPIANDDLYESRIGETLTVDAPGVLANDSDPNGDPLTVEIVNGPQNGSLSLQPDGAFSYTANVPPPPGTKTASNVELTALALYEVRFSSELPPVGVGRATADRAFDQTLFTRWLPLTDSEDPAPWLEMEFDEDITVRELQFTGQRTWNDTEDGAAFNANNFLSGRFQLLAADGSTLLWDSGTVDLPPPALRQSIAPDAPIAGVRIVRFDGLTWQGNRGAISELDVIGDGVITSLNPVVEWSFEGTEEIFTNGPARHVHAAPLIADLDLDGMPEVIIGAAALNSPQSFINGRLVVLDGETGAEEFVQATPELSIGVTMGIGDIDGDGFPEIIAADASGQFDSTTSLVAYEHDLTEKWRSDEINFINNGGISLADLDNDGSPEILAGNAVFDAQGQLLWQTSFPINFPLPVAVDLDLDGDLEVVFGGSAFEHDGTLIWQDVSTRDGSAAVANLDDDPFPEIVVTRSTIKIFEHDGTEIQSIPIIGGGAGAPTLADFDLDGQLEFGILGGLFYQVLEVDGTELWRHPVFDGSARTGSALFDFEGDGLPEVVMRDEYELLILRGTDGRLLWRYPLTSLTRNEFPTIADVDADGHAELLLPGHVGRAGGQYDVGLRVIGGADEDWIRTRQIWNQHAYSISNVNADGTIPQQQRPNWLLPGLNNFRQQGFMPDENSADRFTYRASDGELSAEATVYVELLPANAAPEILSTPDTKATVGFDYLYAVQARDTDFDPLIFSLQESPPGMTIESDTGLIRWLPDAATSTRVTVRVTDDDGLFALQTFVLVVAEPQEVPDLIGLSEAAATTALEGDGFEKGRVRETTDPIMPAGNVLSQTPPAGSIAEFGSKVDLVISLGPGPADTDDDNDGFSENQGDCNDDDNTIFPDAPDPEGDGIDQDCDGFDGVLALTSIELSPAESIVLSNRVIEYEAIGIRADGTAVNLNGLGNFNSSDTNVAQLLSGRRVRSADPGFATISLSYMGVTGEATVTVVAGAATDDEAPIAEITAPSDAQTITAPVNIVGTASDDNLLRWELTIAAGENSSALQLAVGTDSIIDTTIAELDPTVLMNGLYVITLTVYDRGGNVSQSTSSVTVEGNLKVGNFSLAQEDLSLPLAGLPISVIRSYDSRDKQRGDFGIGWQLGLNSVSVNVSQALGEGWEVLGGGTSFVLNSTDDHFVSITLPDGEVHTFELVITPNVSFLVPFSFLSASLQPVGDAKGTMEIVDNNFLVIIDQQPGVVQLLDDISLDLFDPSDFRYISVGGTEFLVNRESGLKQLTDVNGNTITVSQSGISHSSGATVQFTRDSLGRITRITDPVGNEQHYDYDSNGDLASHTDAEGNLTRFRYNSDHGLLEVIDPLGNRAVRNDYDDEGRLIAITDVSGNRLEFTHDIAGREQLVRDAAGNLQRILFDDEGNILVRERTVTIEGIPTVATEQFEYDSAGNQIVIIDADGVRTEQTFDSQNNLIEAVIDPADLALTTSATYNDRGQPLTTTDELGHTTTFEYDESGNLIRTTDPLGQISTNSYSAKGQLLTSTDAAGITTTRTYSSSGALIGIDITDSSGVLLSRTTYTADDNNRPVSESVHRLIDGVLTPITTTFTYNANNQLTRTTDPLGQISQTEYDSVGQIIAEIDPLGNRTEFSYDANGRRTSVIYADGTNTSTSYDVAGNVIATTDELGRITRYEYDELNRRILTIYPDGAEQRVVFSAGSREMAQIDALGQRTDFQYDSAGRRIRTILPEVVDDRNGNSVRPEQESVIDARGNLTRLSDNNGNSTEFTYDALGQLIQTRYADGSMISSTYDAVGRIVSSSDELGRITTRSYDGLGRLLTINQPAPTSGTSPVTTTFSWDLTGNLISQTDALGRITRYEYDVLGNQIRKILPGGQFSTAAFDAVGNIVQQTDFNGQIVASEYDSRNRLVENQLSDGNIENYTYTADSQEATASDAVGTITTSYDSKGRVASINQIDGQTLQYTYNALDQQINLITPTETITYEYDSLGRLLTVTDNLGTTRYGYDLNGNQVSIIRPNLSSTRKVYNSRNRLTSIEHYDASGSLLEQFSYTYYADGQRQTMASSDGSIETYTYDDLGRLIGENRVGNNPRNILYEYDLLGNRTSKNENGNIELYTYDENDRLLTAGDAQYSYDGNGNRTAKATASGTIVYRWNAKSMLESITTGSGQETQFSYDVKGDRVVAERPQITENYLVNPNSITGFPEVVEQRDASGLLIATNTFGTDLISTESDEAIFYHTDAIGSTRLLTSDTSAVSETYAYEAFGQPISEIDSTETPYLFTGERFDEDVDAVYLRARYYDPELGVFLGRDRFPGVLDSPLSLHPYVYASLDPISNLDPSGLFTLPNLQSTFSIISTQLANISVRACSAISTTDQAAIVASILQLGFNIFVAAQTLPDNLLGHKAFIEFPIPKRFGPLEKVTLEVSGDASQTNIKLAFNFDNTEAAQAITFTFDKDGRLIGGLPEVSFGQSLELVEVRFCGLEVGKVEAKVEAAARAGTGATGSLTGIPLTDASSLGFNSEFKGFLEANINDSVALELILFSARGGGQNGGGFSLLGLPIR